VNIHEYQAKQIFQKYGVPTPKGMIAHTVEEAVEAAKTLGGKIWVVKAQIHAGGRGLGGGVKLAKSLDEVKTLADEILGMTLVTHQTGPEGKLVQKVYIEEGANIEDELYLSVVLDRAAEMPIIMASTEGGMDIEKVAAETPDKIIKFGVDPLGVLTEDDCISIASKLKLEGKLVNHFTKTLLGLYEIFTTKDVSLIEINPLITTAENNLLALDGKIDFDDNALYRHEDIVELRDTSQEDEKENEASEHQLNYISLDGTIGCMVNGAGLAMATMDLIEHHGGSPANFLDVGGGTTAERVAKAFELIQTEDNVEGVLVNIFGGIVRCDLIAEGILQAIDKVGLTLPIVVRLEGTNAKQGLALLDESKFDITTEADLTQAAIRIVALSKGASA